MAQYYVANVEDIPHGKSQLVTVDGKEVALFNDNGVFYAILNVCPHARGPLVAGRIEGFADAPTANTLDYDHNRRVLRCPWHHWEFDLESGKAVCNIRHRIVKFPVMIEDGKIIIDKA